MDMDFFYWILIGGAVLSAAGWIIWVVFFVWLAKKVMQQREKAFIQMLSQLDGMLLPNSQGGAPPLDPQRQAQVTQMLMRAHTQLGQLNDLARQRYDTQVAGIMGMAANAGIDWTPPS